MINFFYLKDFHLSTFTCIYLPLSVNSISAQKKRYSYVFKAFVVHARFATYLEYYGQFRSISGGTLFLKNNCFSIVDVAILPFAVPYKVDNSLSVGVSKLRQWASHFWKYWVKLKPDVKSLALSVSTNVLFITNDK